MTRQRSHLVAGMMGIFLLAPFVATVPAGAQDGSLEESESLADDVMKPTDIGVRFTPELARAISGKMTQQMDSRYDLSDDQAKDIQEILARRMMRTMHDNAETGRDMIELMMATAIANDGSFPKEEAVKFAKLSKPIIPAIKDFFMKSSGEVGKKLTMKQRLKLTGDMAGVTAGLVVFENRMKRWEEGDVGRNANPFFDGPESNLSANNSEPEDPNENSEHRRARKQVERWLEWQINSDRNWEAYVDQAIAYYEFDETQVTAAMAILKDCKQRAESIKTPKWRDAVKENRILQRMAYSSGAKFSQGPWIYKIDRAYKEYMKPLEDLGDELKRRIEGVATSAQRAAAREAARKLFAKKGVKQIPA